MEEPWCDPFPDDPPLDVEALTRTIQAAVYRSLRHSEVSRRQYCEIGDAVRNSVAQFDGIRTQHLKFLKGELLKLHRLIVQPVFLPKPVEPR